MSWIVQAPAVSAHRCAPPMRDVMARPPRGPAEMPPGKTREDYPEPRSFKVGERPDGQVGDLWRCDDCGTLWRIIKPEPRRYVNVFPSPWPRWREAGLWLRFRHRSQQ